MSKFSQYNIELKDITEVVRNYEFVLDEEYFKKIDSPEVQRGNVLAKISVIKKNFAYELNFQLDGSIIISCDRCLDDMNLPVRYKEKLLVKFGESFSEENEIVIVPESDGGINIAWFLYEFIVLIIPIKHTHPAGECNQTMIGKLKKHISRKKGDNDEENNSLLELEEDDDDDISSDVTQPDPRWEGLPNITENN